MSPNSRAMAVLQHERNKQSLILTPHRHRILGAIPFYSLSLIRLLVYPLQCEDEVLGRNIAISMVD